MIQKFKQLESAARLLEPDARQRQQLLDQVAAYSQDYLESIAGAPANGIHSDGHDLYTSPIAEEGIALAQALDLLRENVDTTGISTTSGRFLGYIPGGGLFPAALGDYLAAIANRYSGHFFASPGPMPSTNACFRPFKKTAGSSSVPPKSTKTFSSAWPSAPSVPIATISIKLSTS